MLDKSKIKLFKINEYDWVAAEDIEQANEWYESLTGEENDIEEVEEVPLTTTFLTDVREAKDDELNQGFVREIIWEREYIRVPFSYTLSKIEHDILEPWVVASTEC